MTKCTSVQELPKEALYLPPLTLRVVDHRAFGSKPVVATAVVSDLQRYTVEPKAARLVSEHKVFMAILTFQIETILTLTFPFDSH